MRGWTAKGRETRLYTDQAHIVRVLLGDAEPDEAFDNFWRLRGAGRTTVMVTAARYAEAQAAHDELLVGLLEQPRLTMLEAAAMDPEALAALRQRWPEALPLND